MKSEAWTATGSATRLVGKWTSREETLLNDAIDAALSSRGLNRERDLQELLRTSREATSSRQERRERQREAQSAAGLNQVVSSQSSGGRGGNVDVSDSSMLQQHVAGASGDVWAAARGFWPEVAQSLPGRDAHSVYDHARTRFLEVDRSSLTEDETLTLALFVDKHGRKWSRLAKEMGRLPVALRDYYRATFEKEVQGFVSGPWSPDEVQRLKTKLDDLRTAALPTLSSSTSLSTSSPSVSAAAPASVSGSAPSVELDMTFASGKWSSVSEYVRTRSPRQCWMKFHQQVKPTELRPNLLSMRRKPTASSRRSGRVSVVGEWCAKDDAALLQAVRALVHDDARPISSTREIIWRSLIEPTGSKWTGFQLQAAFFRMQNARRADLARARTGGNLEKILDVLDRYFGPSAQKREARREKWKRKKSKPRSLASNESERRLPQSKDIDRGITQVLAGRDFDSMTAQELCNETGAFLHVGNKAMASQRWRQLVRARFSYLVLAHKVRSVSASVASSPSSSESEEGERGSDCSSSSSEESDDDSNEPSIKRQRQK